MEEDIKILEDFKNNNFLKDKLERNEKGGFKIGTIYKTTELNPAIENLINKYKEQEKMIELMAEYIDFDKMDFNCSSLCVKEGCREECVIEFFRKKAR